MSTIRRLIAELKSEMTWLPVSFEDMGDAMHKAIECAEKNEPIAEAEARFDNELDRGQERYEDRMCV